MLGTRSIDDLGHCQTRNMFAHRHISENISIRCYSQIILLCLVTVNLFIKQCCERESNLMSSNQNESGLNFIWTDLRK